MKILFVITGLGMGGAERQVCLLADNFANQNHDVKIVSLNGDAIVLPSRKNIEIINLGIQRKPLDVIKGIFRLKKVIREFKPEVVHGHMFHANIISRLASLQLSRKFVLISTAHNKNEGGFLRMLSYRLTDFLCDVCTNVSVEALDEFINLKAFKKNKSITIYNGIDLACFRYDSKARESIRNDLKIAEDDTLLLAVGRLTTAKDYPNLLAAMNLLPSTFKLIIIGEGELRSEIEKSIIANNLNYRVRLLGLKENVAPYYSACDVFVLSSAWEGFGLVVAEAMACERIVVGTDSGGVKEVIGDAGFLVKSRDAQLLSDMILSGLSLSESDKNNLKKLARTRVVERYSIDSISRQWLSIYQGK